MPKLLPLPISRGEPLFIGFTTELWQENLALVSATDIRAPRTWKDSLKISTYISSKRAERDAAAVTMPVTARLSSFYLRSRRSHVCRAVTGPPGTVAVQLAAVLQLWAPLGNLPLPVNGHFGLFGLEIHACLRIMLIELMAFNRAAAPRDRVVVPATVWHSDSLIEPYKAIVPATSRDGCPLQTLCAATGVEYPSDFASSAKSKAELAYQLSMLSGLCEE